MSLRRALLLLTASWLGAALIALAVVELRDDDVSDVRDELGEPKAQLSADETVQPTDDADATTDATLKAGVEAEREGIRVTILSVSDAPAEIPPATPGAGAVRVRVENVGAPGTVDTFIGSPSATADDGAACTAGFRDATFAGTLQPGQHADMTVVWHCEDLAQLELYGMIFSVPN